MLLPALLAAAPGAALAQEAVDEDLVVTKVESAVDERKDGWRFHLDLSGSFNLTHNRAVVGKPAGLSLALGGGLGTGLVYLSGLHEWSLSLGWKFGLTRTPDLSALSKNQDDFFLESRYLYTFPRPAWLGAFGLVRLESALLPGWVVAGEDLTVIELDRDGTQESTYEVDTSDRVPLTGPFSPLLLKEKAGLMATPVDREPVKLQVDLGLGSHQLALFDTTRRVDDDDDTPEMELRILEPYVQVGAALEARITGEPHETFAYGAGAELMQPFYTSIDTEPEHLELLNVRLDAMLRFTIYEYVVLDLTVEARRYPLVVDKWQVATNLLVTFHYEYVTREPPTPEEDGGED
jgi:hypothetical protein